MRDPIHVLKSLEEKACVKEYRYERLYRNLYNPDFYLLAYKKIATSPGSMTAGADGMSIDKMSMARIDRIIASLKDYSYQPNPARRTYIEKKNSTKKRPLGIPSTDDKLVQEIIRMLLEAIYEPTFSENSHGFRPNRSCHTALTQIQGTFTGVRWMIEGDIKACFDCFDHHVLIGLLRRRIKDEAFLSLMWKFLKAGYMEQWEYHRTYSGTPQGSGMSPILANIYLGELDGFIEEYKQNLDSEPFKRNASKAYEKAARRYRKARTRLESQEEPNREEIREFKEARKLKLSTPYASVLDENFKSIQYNRYADDFVVGVIGSKQDAIQIKEDIKSFLQEKLKLTMSEEKTKVTHSSDAVRYLGYDISVSRSKATKRDKNGDLKRPWYGKVFLYVPHEKWENKLLEYKAMEIKWVEAKKCNYWRPMHRRDLLNKTDIEIVSQFNSEIRGIYNFYRLAENVGALDRFYYMMRASLLKTFAGKYRTIVTKIKRKHMRNHVFCVPYSTKAGMKVCEFYHDGFRKQGKGYSNVQDTLPQYCKYDGRNTLANRLKAGVCEICGVQTKDICIHHVRSLKRLTGKSESERRMMEMRRKSLALCPDCYQKTHAEKPSR